MGKLDALWRYQQADQKVEQLERELKTTPARKSFFRARKTLLEQQDRLATMDHAAQVGRSRVEGIEKEYDSLSKACKKLEDIFEKSPKDALQSVDQLLADYNFLQQKISSLRRELTNIMESVDRSERSLEEIRTIVMEARKNYNHFKDIINAELKEATPQLESLRAAAQEVAKDVDPELLKKYQAIKSNKIVPMALIKGDQCGGCNISLPSLVVNSVREGQKLIECENCGRILYIPQEQEDAAQSAN